MGDGVRGVILAMVLMGSGSVAARAEACGDLGRIGVPSVGAVARYAFLDADSGTAQSVFLEYEYRRARGDRFMVRDRMTDAAGTPLGGETSAGSYLGFLMSDYASMRQEGGLRRRLDSDAMARIKALSPGDSTDFAFDERLWRHGREHRGRHRGRVAFTRCDTVDLDGETMAVAVIVLTLWTWDNGDFAADRLVAQRWLTQVRLADGIMVGQWDPDDASTLVQLHHLDLPDGG
ncbi:hypothetical protein CCR85_13050 [Rhodothalassium salexigens]|uniref:hypothetical protein n=1 Tax=Rhodothalassium salexigens TaxID=1086 RepID=UPI0019131E1D|nr:hypothetical protein [Rhodothalassium salexigens]MBK5912413.1 hypothetical protein [Rhodothalassium salexigens]MBK5921520.1 hypothetical protein [Rhodothalassium salexigens]